MGRKPLILLDTHVLIWMNQADPKLGKAARRTIELAWANQGVAVSAISFWECAKLHANGRILLSLPPAVWRAQLLSSGLIEYAVDGEIALLSCDLALAHQDPADRFIAATAIFYGAALMTAEQKLLAWKHPLKRHDAAK